MNNIQISFKLTSNGTTAQVPDLVIGTGSIRSRVGHTCERPRLYKKTWRAFRSILPERLTCCCCRFLLVCVKSRDRSFQKKRKKRPENMEFQGPKFLSPFSLISSVWSLLTSFSISIPVLVGFFFFLIFFRFSLLSFACRLGLDWCTEISALAWF